VQRGLLPPPEWKGEESPGYSKAGVSLTGCRRKARESATEKRPPMAGKPAQARVKRWGKSPPGGW